MEVIERVRILVLGDSQVGKSTLARALCLVRRQPLSRATGMDEASIADEGPTLGCRIHCRVEELPGKRCILVEFWEVGGAPRFDKARGLFLRRSGFDGVMFVHDLTWRQSRANIRRIWLPELVKAEEDTDRCARDKEDSPETIHHTRSSLWRMMDAMFLRFLKLARTFVINFIGDDLLEKGDERRLLRRCRKPVAIVGMKSDLSNGFHLSSRTALPGATSTNTSAMAVQSNAKLAGFLKSVIEIKRRIGDSSVQRDTPLEDSA
mmetsp:Transcript_6188/g.12144  ORF Transcript_6188/g.12144 Transcript_6188/m.12144 type:complete len:263 (+) Transcript_6188:152-940(+)